MPLLGRIPLKQPDWDKDQFAPSVYDRSHPIEEIYMGIAQKVIEKQLNKKGPGSTRPGLYWLSFQSLKLLFNSSSNCFLKSGLESVSVITSSK